MSNFIIEYSGLFAALTPIIGFIIIAVCEILRK